jgi:hypothetical protein
MIFWKTCKHHLQKDISTLFRLKIYFLIFLRKVDVVDCIPPFEVDFVIYKRFYCPLLGVEVVICKRFYCPSLGVDVVNYKRIFSNVVFEPRKTFTGIVMFVLRWKVDGSSFGKLTRD